MLFRSPKTLETKCWNLILSLKEQVFISKDELVKVEAAIDRFAQVGDAGLIDTMNRSVSIALIPRYRAAIEWLNKVPDRDPQSFGIYKSLSSVEIMDMLTSSAMSKQITRDRLNEIFLEAQAMIETTTFSFWDARSFRAHALVCLRLGKYADALKSVNLASGLRSDIDSVIPDGERDQYPHPINLAILAMSHYQLAQPLPESDPARAEHLAAANEALAQCQAIMADPNALDENGKPWSEDRAAQSLLAEAEALIGGGEE